MIARERIFIYGPPLVGKSTVGEALARHLELPFWDLDGMIVSRAGASIAEIFSQQGESRFREWEHELLHDLCRGKGGVVALGGGTLTRPRTRTLAEEHGEVVLLRAPRETLLERGKASADTRPLLQGSPERNMHHLLAQRQAHYASFPNTVDTEDKTPQALVEEVEVALGRFRVRGMGRACDVCVRPGSLDEIGPIIRSRKGRGPIVVVTDDQVGDLYVERATASLLEAGYQTAVCAFPAGEESKNTGTVKAVWDQFLSAGLERGSTVLALGGGVVGDLAGFAAATYHRGVDWVNIPTSLLAMVDASLGGKTGVDLPQGKNLVGAFHPPRLVWVDPRVLSTLPEEELRGGMAEVIKHGVIADPALFDLAGKGPAGMKGQREALIRRAMGVKVKIIRQDPYDRGRRQALNFGHTVGHAVERASNYHLRHGEAVAIGMVVETALAVGMGLAPSNLLDEITEALTEWGLPVSIPNSLPEEELRRAMRRDKKITKGRMQFSLPYGLGDVRVGIEADEKAWRSALNF